tara:strand:+ start:1743 stop:2537 length:795 start_codon:yes stop_codon:yes gene_type:complete
MSELSWSVVVTTAPRKKPKLKTTVQSLKTAGWDDPIVFAEPDSPTCDAITHTSDSKLGVFHNWIRAAKHALDSGADVIMTVQDDVWFHPDSKRFAESALWPENCGFLSLYTPLHYSIVQGKMKPWGIYPIHTKSLWGAMAMIWHPSVLKEIVGSKKAATWIGRRSTMKASEIEYKTNNPDAICNVDTFLGYCVRDMGRQMHYVNPSFAQHISEYSSIGGRDAKGKRSARFLMGSHGLPSYSEIPVKKTPFNYPANTGSSTTSEE